jgi:hypothetical protein
MLSDDASHFCYNWIQIVTFFCCNTHFLGVWQVFCLGTFCGNWASMVLCIEPQNLFPGGSPRNCFSKHFFAHRPTAYIEKIGGFLAEWRALQWLFRACVAEPSRPVTALADVSMCCQYFENWNVFSISIFVVWLCWNVFSIVLFSSVKCVVNIEMCFEQLSNCVSSLQMCCEHSNVFLAIIALCFQFGNVLWTLGGVFDLKCVVTLLGHRIIV